MIHNYIKHHIILKKGIKVPTVPHHTQYTMHQKIKLASECQDMED